jgi:O-antigen/teichoic acid export membrane protein
VGDRTAGGRPRGWLRVDRARILEFASFLGSVLALQGTRFLFTLLVAAGLQPSEFIAWAQFVTFVGYAPALLLGVGNGMNRLVPILTGRGDRREADEAEGATWSMVAVTVVVSLALSVLLAWANVSTWLAAAILAGSVVTVYQVQQFAMRSRLLFNRASAQQWGWACIIGVGGLVLLRSDRTLGSVLWIWTAGAFLAIAIGFGLRRPVVTRPSPTRTWALLTMGFPIMLSGLLGNLFFTADRWVAVARLEPSAAGSYGLASLIASAVFLVPTVIAQQQYPRMAMLYGEGAPADRLIGAARHQSLVAASASLVTALGVAAFTLLIVPRVLPAYDSVAIPAVILSFGIAALAGGTGYGNLLVVIGALWAYLGILVSCFAIAVPLMLLGSALGGGVGLALGVAAGQVILMVALIISARILMARKAPR